MEKDSSNWRAVSVRRDMLELELTAGGKVSVNPNHIQAVRPSWGTGGTYLELSSGQTIEIAMSFWVVMRKDWALRNRH